MIIITLFVLIQKNFHIAKLRKISELPNLYVIIAAILISKKARYIENIKDFAIEEIL